MHYGYVLPAAATAWLTPAAAISAALQRAGAQRAAHDRRWPALLRTLVSLREAGRRSVRIVDVNCGTGDLLVQAAKRARTLGFVAIEGLGIDRDARLIARARQPASATRDPAIGLSFEIGDAREALDIEAEFPADVVLCATPGQVDPALAATARSGGITVLHDDPGQSIEVGR